MVVIYNKFYKSFLVAYNEIVTLQGQLTDCTKQIRFGTGFDCARKYETKEEAQKVLNKINAQDVMSHRHEDLGLYELKEI